MATAACSDEEFVKLFRELGSPQAIAETLGVSVRNVFARRNRLAQKHGIELLSFSKHSRITNVTHEQKIYSELKTGLLWCSQTLTTGLGLLQSRTRLCLRS
jgi:hypothetical protein